MQSDDQVREIVEKVLREKTSGFMTFGRPKSVDGLNYRQTIVRDSSPKHTEVIRFQIGSGPKETEQRVALEVKRVLAGFRERLRIE